MPEKRATAQQFRTWSKQRSPGILQQAVNQIRLHGEQAVSAFQAATDYTQADFTRLANGEMRITSGLGHRGRVQEGLRAVADTLDTSHTEHRKDSGEQKFIRPGIECALAN